MSRRFHCSIVRCLRARVAAHSHSWQEEKQRGKKRRQTIVQWRKFDVNRRHFRRVLSTWEMFLPCLLLFLALLALWYCWGLLRSKNPYKKQEEETRTTGVFWQDPLKEKIKKRLWPALISNEEKQTKPTKRIARTHRESEKMNKLEA